jgi:hypothetical protein
MSYYPRENFNLVNGSYNSGDILTEPVELVQDNAGSLSDVNLNEYVKKNGGIQTMLNVLQLPKIQFADTTSQTSAFTNNHTSKLDRIALGSNPESISIDELFFSGDGGLISQTSAFTISQKLQIDSNKTKIDENKLQIDENTLKLTNISNDAQNFVISDNIVSIKDSPKTTDIISTSGSSNTHFDKNLSFMRSGAEYRRYYMGLFGNDSMATNSYCIATQGTVENPTSMTILSELDVNNGLFISGDIRNQNTSLNTLSQTIGQNDEDIALLNANLGLLSNQVAYVNCSTGNTDINGNLIISSDTVSVNIINTDSNHSNNPKAKLNIYANSHLVSGEIFLGQQQTLGGGIRYNGVKDRIELYNRNYGTDSVAMDFFYANNIVRFHNNITFVDNGIDETSRIGPLNPARPGDLYLKTRDTDYNFLILEASPTGHIILRSRVQIEKDFYFPDNNEYQSRAFTDALRQQILDLQTQNDNQKLHLEYLTTQLYHVSKSVQVLLAYNFPPASANSSSGNYNFDSDVQWTAI